MIVTVTSQKGGVGKTTTAVSIATGIQEFEHERREYRPLLVDLDPQGHAAVSLGLDPRPVVYIWWRHLAEDRNTVQVYNCELVAGNSSTKRIDADRGALMTFLRTSWPEYRPVVFDTAAHGALQEAAIAAADVVVIPTRPEYLAVDGVNATLALVEELNPHARVIIPPVDVDSRLNEHRETLELLRNSYPGRVTAYAVPSRSAVKEAIAAGVCIWQHGHRALAPVRCAYQQLIQEILEGRK